MEFIKQYGSNSDSEEEPQQQEAPFSFSSKGFYKSNTVAPKGISLSTVQYEASEKDHNEERCNSRLSSTVSDIDFADYLSRDTLDNIEHIEHDDDDISIESEGSEYVPSQEDLKRAYSDESSDEESNPMSLLPQKRGMICSTPMPESSPTIGSPKSPKWTSLENPMSPIPQKRVKICSTPMSESSPTIGSPKSPKWTPPTIGSPKSPKWTPLENPIKDIDCYVRQVAEILEEKLKNDSDIKKYLGGNHSLDHITTQVHQNNEGGKNQRKYDKKHVCYYCGSWVIKMHRHLISKHSDETEIEKLVNMNVYSTERSNAITSITQKGDFLHNCAVMAEQKGILLVLRRPDADNPTESKDYIPCIYCLGFVQIKQAYRHAKSCHFKLSEYVHDSNQFVSQGRLLLHKMTNKDESSNIEWQEIKNQLRSDAVGTYIINDDTLCTWGSTLTIKYGSEQGKHIRDKIRTVATFCTKYNQEYSNNDSVKDIFQISNFDNIFRFLYQRGVFGKALSPSTKLGGYMKEIIVLLKHEAIVTNDSVKSKELDDLLYLVENRWTLISARNLRKLKEQRPIVVEMPITNDIKIFLGFLSDNIKEYLEELKQSQTIELWTNLSKNVLAFLIVFNRRREGEVSKLKLETYTQRPNYEEMETDTFFQTLTTIEKYLCESYSYMSTIGKRNRKVPIVYPHLIADALNTLVDNRKICGINIDNNYFFANSTRNNIRGCDALRELVDNCKLIHNLQKPHLIRSTKLRKHVATIAQILVLNGDELGHLSNHLGHSEAVHRDFYRQQESVIEKTHITKS